MKWFHKQIDLPLTEVDFEELITKLVEKYNLPNWEHAAAIVSTRIQHMPPEQSTTTLEYLRDCIKKNIAYQIAQSSHRKLTHKIQVDTIISALKTNPLDQQAKDALDKAIDEGSVYAKDQLEKFKSAEDIGSVPVSHAVQ